VARRELEEQLFELVGYMITSARNLMDETPLYGPFRLVDAASRLIQALEAEGMVDDRLVSLRRRIDEGKYSVMGDPKAFRDHLDALVLAVVDQMISPSKGGDRPEEG